MPAWSAEKSPRGNSQKGLGAVGGRSELRGGMPPVVVYTYALTLNMLSQVLEAARTIARAFGLATPIYFKPELFECVAFLVKPLHILHQGVDKKHELDYKSQRLEKTGMRSRIYISES